MLKYKGKDGFVYWSVDRCKDSHLFFNDENRPTPATTAVVECMINVGIKSLTLKTLPEFYRRSKVYEYLHGPIMFRGDDPIFITHDLLKKFIGAHHTGADITKAKFRDLIERWVTDNVQQNIKAQEQRLYITADGGK